MELCHYQGLNFNGVSDTLTLLGLSILAGEDVLKGEIHYRYLLLLVGFSFPQAYICMFGLIVFYPYISAYIGGADLLIFCLLFSKYGLSILNIISLSCIFGLLYCLMLRKKKLRFIPCILFATCIILGG